MDSAELLASLQQLHLSRQAEILARWRRAVPFGDEIIDRWEKARALGFGEGSSVYDSALIIGDVRVGEKTWIGPFTVLDGSHGLTIGRTCSISAGVQIYTHDSIRWALSGGQAEHEYGAVSIGDHSYLGPQVIVTSGVSIGRHCLVGANSIVNKDLPDYSIAFGSTCRIVGRVELSAEGGVELRYLDGAEGPRP
jgi:acetyltransferase-like isoleucine patch superfamily enzyme